MPKIVYTFEQAMEKLQNDEVKAVSVEYGNTPKSKAYFQKFDGTLHAYMPANAGEKAIEQDAQAVQNALGLISSAYKVKIDML